MIDIVVEPTSPDDTGEYTFAIRISDGCLFNRQMVHIYVLETGGYAVFDSGDVPPPHVDALVNAINGAGRLGQRIFDLGLIADFPGLLGVFIPAGIYGAEFVLTAENSQPLSDYL